VSMFAPAHPCSCLTSVPRSSQISFKVITKLGCILVFIFVCFSLIAIFPSPLQLLGLYLKCWECIYTYILLQSEEEGKETRPMATQPGSRDDINVYGHSIPVSGPQICRLRNVFGGRPEIGDSETGSHCPGS
jgi:hypothetical protein